MITRAQFNRIPNCPESLDYVARQPSLAAAWENCERPDWLLAFARKAEIASQEQYVRVAIGEAEVVLHIWTAKYPDDDLPQKAIKAAKDWVADQTSALRAAAAAAAGAAYAAYAAAYAAAAGVDAANIAACAYSAYAAYNAAYAAGANAAGANAAHAAAATAYAAYDAATVAENKDAFRRAQCDRIRAIIPNPFINPPQARDPNL